MAKCLFRDKQEFSQTVYAAQLQKFDSLAEVNGIGYGGL
jgi:hypothetical protein